MRKNVVEVARNCERMGKAKVNGDETACPPHSLKVVMEMREGKKWIHKRRRNIYDRGHPPISKSEGLAETAAWRKDWQVDEGTADGSTSEKCGISVGVSGVNVRCRRPKDFLCEFANKEMKFTGDIAGNSANERNKFTARQWEALIGFSGVETQKQVQKFGKKLKRLVMQQRCAPLWSLQTTHKSYDPRNYQTIR